MASAGLRGRRALLQRERRTRDDDRRVPDRALLHPEDPMLYVYRACAYDELGQLAEAVADCEAALGLAPRGPAAVFALITLALARERLGRTRTSSGAGAGITVTDLGGNFALTSGLLQF